MNCDVYTQPNAFQYTSFWRFFLHVPSLPPMQINLQFSTLGMDSMWEICAHRFVHLFYISLNQLYNFYFHNFIVVSGDCSFRRCMLILVPIWQVSQLRRNVDWFYAQVDLTHYLGCISAKYYLVLFSKIVIAKAFCLLEPWICHTIRVTYMHLSY